MRATWVQRLRSRLTVQLFDSAGMEADTKRSLNLIILAVLFGNVCITITAGPAWSGFLKELGTDDFIYSLMYAIPIVGSLFQLVASFALERTGKRRFLMIFFGIVSRLTWVGIGLVPLFVGASRTALRLWTIVLLLVLQSFSATFLNAGFNSLVADVVPMRIRGRYFAMRSRLMTIAAIVACVASAWLIGLMPGMTGYIVVLVIAGVFGALDLVCFLWVRYPPMREVGQREGLLTTLRGVFRDRMFMRMVAYFTLWTFAVNLSAPFFTPYMTYDLGMSMDQIIFLSQIMSAVGTVLVITRWGRLMDEFGYRPAMHLAMCVAAIIPFLWTFTDAGRYLAVPMIQFLSGVVWCAVDLGTQNFMLHFAPQRNRTIYIAVQIILTQVLGAALGMATGGKIATLIEPLVNGAGVRMLGFDVTHYNLIFLLSGALRVLVVVVGFSLVPQRDSQPMADMLAYMRASTSRTVVAVGRTARAWPRYTIQRLRTARRTAQARKARDQERSL